MEKLIEQYKNTISELDVKINSITIQLRRIRNEKGALYEFQRDDLVTEKKINDAKIMQLFQVVKDLEDYIETTL